MAARISPSDRKITSTRTGGSAYRVPGVTIVGVTQPPGQGVSEGDGEDSNNDMGGGELGVPSNFKIESQNARQSADGNTVIDVVVSYDPAPGAVDHEVRVSKR